MQLLVNNIDLNLLESDIRRLFMPFGEVDEVLIVRDRMNNRSLGRALVRMPVPQQAQAALNGLNGYLFGSRSLVVTPAPVEA